MRNQLGIARGVEHKRFRQRAGNPANVQGARRLCNGYRCQANDTNYARLNAISPGKSRPCPARLKTNPQKNGAGRINDSRGSAVLFISSRPIAPDFTSRAHVARRRNALPGKPRCVRAYVCAYACVSAREPVWKTLSSRSRAENRVTARGFSPARTDT